MISWQLCCSIGNCFLLTVNVASQRTREFRRGTSPVGDEVLDQTRQTPSEIEELVVTSTLSNTLSPKKEPQKKTANAIVTVVASVPVFLWLDRPTEAGPKSHRADDAFPFARCFWLFRWWPWDSDDHWAAFNEPQLCQLRTGFSASRLATS